MFMKLKVGILCVVLCFPLLKLIAQDKRMDELWGETSFMSKNENLSKTKLFDEGNFGMFIHWGLYSSHAGKWNGKTYYGIGEWLMNPRVANIPSDDYKRTAQDFNPNEFDAKKIVKLAKDAGMKYIIITSKHHEGFAMYDSKVSDFTIVKASPFGRDPMKELSAECRKQGLGFGFYYSHYQDWTTPGAGGALNENSDGEPATFENYYYKKCKPQVREICSNYGDIDFIWFDTPGGMKKEYIVELVEMVRKLQPNAMLCSRVGYGLGDYFTLGDMEVPHKNIPGLWETCDTNNDSWSYAWYDNNFKSPKEILQRLISTVGRGGSYLFNIGPNAKGDIPEIGYVFLEEAGKWIKKYPQVIYNAGCSPWGCALPWGDVTTQDKSLFLSVFEWPKDGKLYLPGLESNIISARVLNGDDSEPVSFEKHDNWITLNVPPLAIENTISVIEVKFDVEASQVVVDQTLGVCPNFENDFLVEFAEVFGAEKTSIRWMEKFGEWKKTTQVSNWESDGRVVWDVEVMKAGYYKLYLTYKGEQRLVWKIETDEGKIIQNQQAATEKYQTYTMGVVEFLNPGKHNITVSLVEGDKSTSSLKSITIEHINY
jgi:alpha-L-fucosidase